MAAIIAISVLVTVVLMVAIHAIARTITNWLVNR